MTVKEKILTLPLEKNAALLDTKKNAKFLELEASEWFGKGICDHVVSGAVGQTDVTLGDGLADEMKMDINVLGMAMERRIFGKSYSTLVIAK